MTKAEMEALAAKAGAAQGLPPGLLQGLITWESGWNVTAQGLNKNAMGDVTSVDRGVAQINSVAHPEVSADQAVNPAFAIPWAAAYLGKLLRSTDGNVSAALQMYNSGRPTGAPAYAADVLAAAQKYGYTAAGKKASTDPKAPAPTPAPTPAPSAGAILDTIAMIGAALLLLAAL